MQNIPIKNSRISEITIEHLKSSHPIDRYYEAIIRIITEIEDLVGRKNDRDMALLFLDGGVLDKWIHLSALAYTIRPICREDYHYNDVQIGKNNVRIDEDMLLDVVRTRELLTRMSNLRNKFCELAEETARTYGGCSTHYKENKHGWCHTTVWNFIVNGYEDIIDKTEESITGSELDYLDRFQNGLEDFCYRIKCMIYDMQHNVDSVSYLAKENLKTICPKPAEYKKILEDGLRDYSQSNGRVLMEQLELATKHFKQKRSEPLSPDVWGNLMKEEDNFLRSVIDCEQPTLDTAIGEVLGYTDFEELKANAPLVRAILKASRDEKVFDLDLAAKEPINLFDVITPDNLYLFMKLVLRRNLIQCQMFPHMKEAYELWLSRVNAEEVDGNKDNCTSQPELEFDKNAVLTYVSKIKEADEETNEKMKTFWSSLVERWAELTTIRYNKSESCFKRGRSEDKNVNFSKKFVCCVIGYLINTDKYHLTNTKICEMLGENSDNGSARLKNMQDSLKDYDNKVEKVVKEVIKEVFG